jgi:hypothetical protein
MRAGLLALAALAIAALALALDLSPLDPFGPRLGWSPGVIIVAGFATLLLIRSGTER